MFLNGGIEILIPNTEYIAENLQPLDSIKTQLSETSPELLILKGEIESSRLTTNLSKQNWLPEFEIGYEAESEPDGTYSGIKAGISIPLWQNKNQVILAQANYTYSQSIFESSKQHYLNSLEKDYYKAEKYQEILSDYKSMLDNSSDLDFIAKAFNAGQISIIEYITELSFYYNITDNYLDTEKAYYQAVAKLYFYTL